MGLRKSEEMFPLVEEYLGGALKRKAFSELHGFPISTLDYWIGRYRRSHAQEEGSDFVQIDLREISGTKYKMEMQTCKGSLFRFDRLVSSDYLKKLTEL